jgi:glyoxylase-like metal-dependent hydrolase (beta-lactamase superfamily II)
MGDGSWERVLPDVLCWRDSCNVYAVLGPEAALIVNAGTGAWLDGLGDLPVPARAVAVTHYFRDHSAGAVRAAQVGIEVYVPEHEERIFRDPLEHFRAHDTYLLYDNLWDLFAPTEPVAPAGVLRDYERVTLAGLDVDVIPQPGATPTQVGLVLLTPASGKRVAFCGETIHSRGRVPRLAPLQYNYNDLPGVVGVAFSADLLRLREPDVVLPSLGDPIDETPGEALQALHENLVAHTTDRGAEHLALGLVGRDAVKSISERVWSSTQGRAASTFIVGDRGTALILDYGYWYATGSGAVEPGFDPGIGPARATPERRRPLLHSLQALERQAGVEEFEAVIPTHYHDDHISGIALLQRVHGVPCWAPENFARLLSDPAGHRFPCAWPIPISVERELSLREPFEWGGITFHLGPMSGHTRFSALIGWEVDGTRFVHAGDQYGPTDPWLAPSKWSAPGFSPNHVYANGVFLDAYRRSADWVTAFRPDIVLSGHWRPVETDDAFFQRLAEYGRRFEEIHERAMALDADAAHFGVDSLAGWMWPYRTHVAHPEPLSFEVVVRNPLPVDTTLELVVTGPVGWQGSTVRVSAAARGEVSAILEIQPDGPCRRQPVTVEVKAGGRSFGQLLEALVTIGGEMF